MNKEGRVTEELTTRPGGLLAWLRRVVAGEEIAALEATIQKLRAELVAAKEAAEEPKPETEGLEARVRELEGALRAAQAMAEELQKLLDERATPPTAASGEEKALRDELQLRVRENDELTKTLAKRDAERRDVSAKLAKVQATADAADKRVKELEARAKTLEAKLKEAESKARDSSPKLSVQNSDKKVAELEAAAKRATAELGAREAKIADLEKKLVEALAEKSDPDALQKALADREALVEELESSLKSLRLAFERTPA